MILGLCGRCVENMFQLRDRSGVDRYGTDDWEDVVGDSFAAYNPDYPNDEGYGLFGLVNGYIKFET